MNNTPKHTPGPFRIESRWPAWAKWKIVTPRPHGEKFPFDDKGLFFMAKEDAESALAAMSSANAGEFRIVHDDSTATHTPGPWSLSEPRRRDWGGSGEWYECLIFVGAGGQHGNALATVNLGGVGATNTGKAEVMANARLIAAAPCLLEALKGIKELAKYGENGFGPDIAKICDTAIQKAEGL